MKTSNWYLEQNIAMLLDLNPDYKIKEEIQIVETIYSKEYNESSFVNKITSQPDTFRPFLGRGSGLIRSNENIILQLNIIPNSRYFNLIISINHGNAMVSQSFSNADKKRRFELNMNNLASETKTKIDWEKINHVAITISPTDQYGRDNATAYKHSISIIRNQVFNFHVIQPNEKNKIDFASLQTISFYPLLERADQNLFDYSLDNLYSITDQFYSHSFFEFNNWRYHDFYEDIGMLHTYSEAQEDDLLASPSDFKIENLLIEGKPNSMIISPHLINSKNEEIEIKIDKNNSFKKNVLHRTYQLGFVESTYYDYVREFTCKGINNENQIKFGYVVPYSFSGSLNLKINLDISRSFQDTTIWINHNYKKPKIDFNNGEFKLTLLKKDLKEKPANYDKSFSFNEKDIEIISNNTEFNGDDLAKYEN